jgi:hypothetical protein
MKLTDLTEEEMLKAVFVSLKEMDEDDMMFALEDRGVDGFADSISTRVRNSYSSYCVSPPWWPSLYAQLLTHSVFFLSEVMSATFP